MEISSPWLVILSILFVAIKQSFSELHVLDHLNNVVLKLDTSAASFGPSFSSVPLEGLIIPTTPKNGCSRIEQAPFLNVSNFVWIALIPRTKGNASCYFDKKVKNAQNANFSAVIVYNYEDSLITMGSNGENVNIPSSMVSFTDGNILLKNFSYEHSVTNNESIRFYVKISDDPSFNVLHFLIAIGCLLFIVLLIFSVILLVKCFVYRNQMNITTLSRSALKKLKLKKFVKGDRWDECVICLETFAERDNLRILPCSHAYHRKCIDRWLLRNDTSCPLCKRDVLSEEQNHNETTPLISDADRRTTNGQSFSSFQSNLTLNSVGSPSDSNSFHSNIENSLEPLNENEQIESLNAGSNENFLDD